MKLIPVAYLSSYLLSLLGNSIAGVALPLIVLQVTGSALGGGAVAAATAIPAILAGLLMGVVIDRINRRTSSVVTDLVSAAAVAALPVIDLISGLSLGWFILFGIIGSLGDVPGMTARDALLPAIVRHSGVSAERLVGIREALGAIALLLGPAVAGTLMVLFDGSTVLWVTAATSLAATLLTLLIPHRVGRIDTTNAREAAVAGNGWSELRDGWRVLFRSRFLVVTTVLSAVSLIVLASLQGLILPVYFTLEDQPGLLGFVLTALAGGMLLGGTIYAVAGTRGRRRVWFLTGLLGSTVGFGIIASLSSVWAVFAGAFVVGLSSGLFGSLIGVLMIERIPEHLRGRVMGTQNAVMTAAPSAGILAAAVLTEYAGVNLAAIVLAGLWLIALILGLAARSMRNLEPGAEPEDDGTAVVGSA
ncbi:Major facilitator superfamily MFS_1 [Microbacterium sp. C448]|uniref:MFS transporter n=1 Tax=Microbacterium sp. C448 TaxID=1177594 RepID=UPI0003DE0FBF|nr:MFS transporter [Microbacterium sp. C448]CDJ99321.1 Major facilitator superfamily MFS_1 [Microbacterium sp. C448]